MPSPKPVLSRSLLWITEPKLLKGVGSKYLHHLELVSYEMHTVSQPKGVRLYQPPHRPSLAQLSPPLSQAPPSPSSNCLTFLPFILPSWLMRLHLAQGKQTCP